MDRDPFEDSDLLLDLETGMVTSEEGTRQDVCIGDNNTQTWNSEVGTNTYLEVVINGEKDDECRNLVEKYEKKKYNNKMNNKKKASKPPRPPKGPSLDALDMMLVKEISTHAINRRARIERTKALRKMREEKLSLSSSKSSIWAMIFTVLFILVICFQGFCSKGVNNGNFHGSPEPARGSMISVQFFNQPSGNGGSELGSSLSPWEHTVGSNFQENINSDAV